MRTHLPLAVLSIPFLVSCGSGSSGGSEPPPSPPPAGVISQSTTELVFATGEFEVPPGDSFTCFYLDITTDKELSTYAAQAQQNAGGHHVTVYYTDQKKPAQSHTCSDDEMVSWHQVAAAGGEGTGGVISLSDGLALKVPAGKQLVMQSHYINTTGQPRKVDDVVTLQMTDPANVRAYVNYLALVDETFDLQPHGSTTSSLTCTLSQDFNAVLMLGHMHQYGMHYTLERVDDAGNQLEMLYQTDWTPQYTSHPPVTRFTIDQPKIFPQGTKLRQTCTWNNTTDAPLIFPDEMCVSFLYYFPDAGSFQCTHDGGMSHVADDLGSDGSGGTGGASGDPTPAASCTHPGDTGNANGVGRYCTPGGGECKGSMAPLCLADVGQDQWFCTRLGCKTDADCGDAAHCHMDADGAACVPDKCEPAGSGGTGGSGGAGGASGSAGAGG